MAVDRALVHCKWNVDCTKPPHIDPGALVIAHTYIAPCILRTQPMAW